MAAAHYLAAANFCSKFGLSSSEAWQLQLPVLSG
jgi:hypothetical protein